MPAAYQQQPKAVTNHHAASSAVSQQELDDWDDDWDDDDDDNSSTTDAQVHSLGLTTVTQSVNVYGNILTLWRPLLPFGYSYKASCARPG